MKTAQTYRGLPVNRFSVLGTLILVAVNGISFGQQQASGSPPADLRAAKIYGKLPLSFEANRGQTGAQADYLARGAGYSLFLTGAKAVFAFSHRPAPAFVNWKNNPRSRFKPTANGSEQPEADRNFRKTEVLEMQLAGGRAGIEAQGESALPGTANYFKGSDPAQWHTGIPTYKKVRYAGVYPGVDLVYYGNQSRLEYDFVVAPRADAGRIRLRFGGAKKLTLDRGGNLIVQMEDGSVSFHKPVVYQDSNGVRQPVEGASFRDRGDGLANRGTGRTYRDGQMEAARMRARDIPSRIARNQTRFRDPLRPATGFGEGFRRNG